VKNFLIAALLVALFLTGEPAFAAPKRIALMLEGSDENVPGCFNNLCSEGLKRAQEHFGKKVATRSYNALEEREKLLPLLREAASKSDLVIVSSIIYNKYLAQVMREFPSCDFLTLDANEERGVAEIVFREEEGGFLAGALAAMLTARPDAEGMNADKTVGAILGEKTPPVERFKSGFLAGVWYVDPNTEALCEYVGDFSNREKAADIALGMKGRGADIIFLPCGEAGIGAVEGAEKGGYFTIAADSELEKDYPQAVLASVVKRTGHVIYIVAEGYVKGEIGRKGIGGEKLSLGMKEGCIDISIWTREAKSSIPADIRESVEDIGEKIRDGLIVIKETDYRSMKDIE